jgi:hypothetical protein
MQIVLVSVVSGKSPTDLVSNLKTHVRISLSIHTHTHTLSLYVAMSLLFWGHAVAWWLRHYTTKRKVAGSIPDEANF